MLSRVYTGVGDDVDNYAFEEPKYIRYNQDEYDLENVACDSNIERDLIEQEEYCAVRKALDQLNKRQREVVARTFGFAHIPPQSNEQIAKSMGIVVKTVEYHKNNAFKMLKLILDPATKTAAAERAVVQFFEYIGHTLPKE